MKKSILLLSLFLVAWASHGRIFLNISIVHQKKIDTRLVLLSTLHAREEVVGQRPVLLQVKDGPAIRVAARFANDFSSYGPSTNIHVKIESTGLDGEVMQSSEGAGADIGIGEKKSFQFTGTNNQIG